MFTFYRPQWAKYATNRNSEFERGGRYYQESLKVNLGDAECRTYEAWCADLAAKGVDSIRVVWSGRNRPDKAGLFSFEPPPAFTYNIWHSVLDPSDLKRYRANQSDEAPPPNWEQSNVKMLLDACEKYGIGIIIGVSESGEFASSAWRYHAWNRDNRYVDGSQCQPADRGFLTNAYEFCTDLTALQAMFSRIDYIFSLVGDSPAVVAWDIMREMSWCCTADFWDEPSWNSNVRNNIRTKLVPWVDTVASYIKEHDPRKRPVIHGHIRVPPNYTWSSNPDNYWNVIGEIFNSPDIDILGLNSYFCSTGEYTPHVDAIKAARERWPDKIIHIEQFYPWDHKAECPVNETDTRLSVKHLWFSKVLKGGISGCRWQGLIEKACNYFVTGSWGDPDLYSIAGVPKVYDSLMDRSTWGETLPWDDHISSLNAERVLGSGDREHVTFVVTWQSGGTKTVQVESLVDGKYELNLVDWRDGAIVRTLGLNTTEGQATFQADVTEWTLPAYSDYMMVGYLERQEDSGGTEPPPAPPEESVTVTVAVGDVIYHGTIPQAP